MSSASLTASNLTVENINNVKVGGGVNSMKKEQLLLFVQAIQFRRN
jgi:hypothetical protein